MHFQAENAEHVFIINKIKYIIIRQFKSLDFANKIKLNNKIKINTDRKTK